MSQARKSGHLCPVLRFIFWFARGLLIWDKISLCMPSSKFELAEILLSWNYRHKPPGPDTSHVLDLLEELPTLRRPFWEPWDIGSIGLQASSRATVVCSKSSVIRETFLYPLLAARIPAGAHTVLPEPAWAVEKRKFPQDCVRCPWFPTICFNHWITEDDESDSSCCVRV